MSRDTTLGTFMGGPPYRVVVWSPEAVGIGLVVRRLRLERRWSQKELGKRAKLGEVTISHIEIGKRTPSDKILKRFAKVFGVTLDVFFSEVDPC